MPVSPSLQPDPSSFLVRAASCIQDLTDHSRLICDWNLRYDQISRGHFEGGIREAWLEGVQIFEERLSQSVFQSGQARAGTVSLGVFSSLSGEARWMGKPLTLNHVSCLYQGEELLLRTPQSSTLLVLSVPCGLLDEESRHCPPSTVENAQLAERLRLRIEATMQIMMERPFFFMVAQARRQFLSDVTGVVEEYLRACRRGDDPVAQSKARRVVQTARSFLDERRDEAVTIDELCLQTYTSRRTLQNCFEQVTGVSPAVFLKAVRLNNVRRDLFREGRGAQVSDIAARWGFWHLSQFALDYKRMFGESPSQTIQASRV